MADQARRRAIRVLQAVLPAKGDGESLRPVLAREREGLASGDQGLMADLAFGVCRHKRLLEHWLRGQMKKPLKPSARKVELALMAGLYEVWFTERPDHAVLNAWPDLCRRLGASWATGLCNALLRKATATDAHTEGAAVAPAIRHSLPDWLWKQLQTDWPEQAETLAANLSRPAPLAVCANRHLCTRDELKRELTDAGFAAEPGALAADTLYIDPPRPVEHLPGFAEGRLSVQDEAAQLPAMLIEVPEGGRILDACAAPGGKTAQLCARHPEAEVLALDVDETRLQRVTDNLQRLGLRAETRTGAAEQPDLWWDGAAFDAILVDAPCSATGILRRQPDTRWHRRADDIASLVGLQAEMLGALWPLVKPGGMLVYATCSLLKAENEEQVQQFLTGHRDARADTPPLTPALPASVGCQLPASARAQDGFFFARLRKQA